MKKITLLLFSVLLALNFVSAQVSYQNLYVVGNGCDAGWDPGKALEMNKVESGVFTWTGNLYKPTNVNSRDSERFKFLVARDWHPSITCRLDVDGHLMVSSGDEVNLFVRPTDNTGYDNAFQVSETGIYTVVVNLNTMKMICTLAGDINEPTPDLYKLYISGSALSSDGIWDYDNPTEMTILDVGIFTWTGNLYNNLSGNQLKFRNENDSWNRTFCSKEENTSISTGEFDLVFRPYESSPNDYNFIVTTPGEYTINVNLNTMKMTCTRNTTVPELFIVGDACVSKWDPSSAPAMTVSGDGTFTWKGTLLSNKEFKFLTARAWENSITVGDPESENVVITSGTPENLRIRASDQDGNDNKFQVPVTGKYTVTVDLNEMTMVCTEEQGETTFSQLFIVGDATDAGWDTETALEMESKEDGIFTWKGKLLDNTGDNGNRGFKFLTARAWENSITVGNPSSGYVIISSGAEEILRVNIGGNDNRFQVPESGTYIVVVDLNTMVMTVTKSSDNRIIEVKKPLNEIVVVNKTVKIETNGTNKIRTAGIYDITGRCLNLISNVKGSAVLAGNLANGIYIVKMNIDNKEYAQKIIIR